MTDPTIDKAALEAARKAYAARWMPANNAVFSHQAAAQVDYIIRAYLAALPPTTDGVSVRELEWVWSEFHSTWWADSALGEKSYRAWEISGSGVIIRPGDTAGVIVGKSIDEAKAAAQADYTARIMASLNISEAEPVAWQWRYWYSSGEPGVWLNERRPDADDLLENNILIREEKRPLYASPTTPPQAPEGVRDGVLDVGTIRVCPERDGRCPHGMSCKFSIDRYHCDIESSRAALKGNRT